MLAPSLPAQGKAMGPEWGPDHLHGHRVTCAPTWRSPQAITPPRVSGKRPGRPWSPLRPEGAPPFPRGLYRTLPHPHGAARPRAPRPRCKQASCPPAPDGAPGAAGCTPQPPAEPSCMARGWGWWALQDHGAHLPRPWGLSRPCRGGGGEWGVGDPGRAEGDLQKARPEEAPGGRVAGLAAWQCGPRPPSPQGVSEGGRGRSLRPEAFLPGSDELGLASCVIEVLGPVSQPSKWVTAVLLGPWSHHQLRSSQVGSPLPSPVAPGHVWDPRDWGPMPGGPGRGCACSVLPAQRGGHALCHTLHPAARPVRPSTSRTGGLAQGHDLSPVLRAGGRDPGVGRARAWRPPSWACRWLSPPRVPTRCPSVRACVLVPSCLHGFPVTARQPRSGAGLCVQKPAHSLQSQGTWVPGSQKQARRHRGLNCVPPRGDVGVLGPQYLSLGPAREQGLHRANQVQVRP